MPQTRHNNEQAFSLVELSIVLVILGLLAGGVLSGRALIRAAEIKSVGTQYERYHVALNSFRDKYMALPGDMPNATQFWGRMAATADCVTNSSAAVNASKGVCDGNGDGNPDGTGAAGKSEEALQFWRELANAGLIEGTYTGVAGSNGGADWTPGVNQPAGKISNTGWGGHLDGRLYRQYKRLCWTIWWGVHLRHQSRWRRRFRRPGAFARRGMER